MNGSLVLAYDLFRSVILVLAIAVLAGRLRERSWPVGLAVVGIVVGMVWAWWTYQIPYDFKRFWLVGRDLGAGLDYYRLDPRGDRQLILNPPTVLPWFRLWSLMPMPTAARNWTIANVLGVLGLVPLAASALRSQAGPDVPRPSGRPMIVLAAAVSLSCAQGMGLALGQVSLLAVAAIFAALRAQGKGRPWWAGFWLGLATIKANTMLPFLLLFLRRRDLPSWLGLGLTTLGLCLATAGPSELPRRIETTLATIRETFEPGQVNDYTERGPSHGSLVGVDQALYRLGMRDRVWIKVGQVGILAGLGLVLAWGIVAGRWPRERACGLVAFYAGIFFYHRIYDLVLLVLPIVGMTMMSGRSDPDSSRSRAAGVLALLVLFVNPEGLLAIEALSGGLGASGAWPRALTAPMAFWLIALALGLGGKARVGSGERILDREVQGTRIWSRSRPRIVSAESPSASAS